MREAYQSLIIIIFFLILIFCLSFLIYNHINLFLFCVLPLLCIWNILYLAVWKTNPKTDSRWIKIKIFFISNLSNPILFELGKYLPELLKNF